MKSPIEYITVGIGAAVTLLMIANIIAYFVK